MTSELQALQQKQDKLWTLKEGQTSTEEIQKTFHELHSEYDDLMDADNDVAIRYEYLRLCLRCLTEFKNSALHNIDYYTTGKWRETIGNEDFPVELETQLLKAVEAGLFNELIEVRLIADRFAREEDYDKAIRYYEHLKNKLAIESSWDKWADCYANQENYAAAVEVLTDALAVFPDSQFLGSNRGFYLHKNKKNKEALEQLQQVISNAEMGKYTEDGHYIYALKLKASIYRELYMPLQALIEYSRLSTAGNCDQDEMMELGELMIPHVKGLSNE